jgi:hypothetical protein
LVREIPQNLTNMCIISLKMCFVNNHNQKYRQENQ